MPNQILKIAYFGTSEVGIPILETLHQHHDIRAVITSPDQTKHRSQIITPSPIANLATKLGLLTLKPAQVKNNPEFLKQLRHLNADIFIVVSYGKILPLELLNIPPLQTINVHFSILPKYRGPSPVQHALLNGDTTTGVTIFILDQLIDHGPILASANLLISEYDNNITLQTKLAHLSATLLLTTLPKYQSKKITPTPQNHNLATQTKIFTKKDGQINWQDTSTKIFNQFRALTPWPGIYTTWQNKLFKIIDCRPLATYNHALNIGQTNNGVVGCGHQTYLQLIKIQMEGKNPVLIQDFINGHSNFIQSNFD